MGSKIWTWKKVLSLPLDFFFSWSNMMTTSITPPKREKKLRRSVSVRLDGRPPRNTLGQFPFLFCFCMLRGLHALGSIWKTESMRGLHALGSIWKTKQSQCILRFTLHIILFKLNIPWHSYKFQVIMFKHFLCHGCEQWHGKVNVLLYIASH